MKENKNVSKNIMRVMSEHITKEKGKLIDEDKKM